MSIRHNGKVIAGATQYHPDLFDWKWADHQLDDVQWLRADTFSWQSGAVYQAAYQHLADDITGKTLQSETISGITIQFYLADDGHKICPVSEESNVAAIYSATGVAWYYIIDTTNQRFKLPRTKKPETDCIPDFANQQVVTMPFTAPSDGWFIAHALNVSTEVSVNGVSVAQGNWYSGRWSGNLNCQIIVKKGDVVTGAAGTMRFIPFIKPNYNDKNEYKYIYFFVGSFTQTALENTAGLNAELFNGKADITSILPMVSPDYANAVTVTATTTEQSYTCPSYGFVVVDLAGFNWNYCYLKINDISMFNKTTNGSGSLIGATGQYMVSAGDVCKFKSGYNNGETFAALGKFMFIPCKGVN